MTQPMTHLVRCSFDFPSSPCWISAGDVQQHGHGPRWRHCVQRVSGGCPSGGTTDSLSKHPVASGLRNGIVLMVFDGGIIHNRKNGALGIWKRIGILLELYSILFYTCITLHCVCLNPCVNPKPYVVRKVIWWKIQWTCWEWSAGSACVLERDSLLLSAKKNTFKRLRNRHAQYRLLFMKSGSEKEKQAFLCAKNKYIRLISLIGCIPEIEDRLDLDHQNWSGFNIIYIYIILYDLISHNYYLIIYIVL